MNESILVDPAEESTVQIKMTAMNVTTMHHTKGTTIGIEQMHTKTDNKCIQKTRTKSFALLN